MTDAMTSTVRHPVQTIRRLTDRIPATWAATLNIAATLTGALLALAAIALTAYLLYTHGHQPVSLGAFTACLVPTWAAIAWLFRRTAVTREIAERADDTADRTHADLADLRDHVAGAEAPPTGRHAARRIAH